LAGIGTGGGNNSASQSGTPDSDTSVSVGPADAETPPGLVIGALAAAGLVGGGVGLVAARNKRRERIGRERTELIDGDVAELDPAGQELPLLADYLVAYRNSPPDTDTRTALAALERVNAGLEPHDPIAMEALWAHGLVGVIDRDRLLAETEIPFALRASSEQPLLEGALQAGIRDALDVDEDQDDEFVVKRQDLLRIIASLRPHRIANTRFRMGARHRRWRAVPRSRAGADDLQPTARFAE
jgi:hypothetical protein